MVHKCSSDSVITHLSSKERQSNINGNMRHGGGNDVNDAAASFLTDKNIFNGAENS